MRKKSIVAGEAYGIAGNIDINILKESGCKIKCDKCGKPINVYLDIYTTTWTDNKIYHEFCYGNKSD